MDRAHRWFRRLFLGVVAMVLSVATVDAAPETISAALPLSVQTTDGHSYAANRIRLGWNDVVQIAGPSGEVIHVTANRIAKILDADGNDLTQAVLGGHEVIGTASGTADSLNADLAAAESIRSPRPPPLGGFLIQGAYMVRVGESKEFIDTGYGAEVIDRVMGQAELGGMGRVSDKYGVGLSVFLGGNTDMTLLGFKARVRRSLGPQVVLDIAPGYVRQIPTNGDLRESRGFIGEASLVANGWIGFTTQVQSVQLDTADGGTKTELWWYAGPKLMGIPGIPAAILAALAVGLSQVGD